MVKFLFVLLLFLPACILASSESSWVGTTQYELFDDLDVYSDDGTYVEGFRTSDQIRVDEAPTLSYHVVRKTELDALEDRIAVVYKVEVDSLANPSTELALYESASTGTLIIAYDESQNFTVYTFEDTQTIANAPYIVDGASGSWIAVAGAYVHPAVTLRSNLSSLATISAEQLTSTDDATITDALAVGGVTTLGDDTTIGGDLLPEAGNTYDLGSSDVSFRTLHVTSIVTPGGGASVPLYISGDLEPGDGTYTIGYATPYASVKAGTIFAGNELQTDQIDDYGNGFLASETDIVPLADSTYDLGTSSLAWAEGHFESLYATAPQFATQYVDFITTAGFEADSAAYNFAAGATRTLYPSYNIASVTEASLGKGYQYYVAPYNATLIGAKVFWTAGNAGADYIYPRIYVNGVLVSSLDSLSATGTTKVYESGAGGTTGDSYVELVTDLSIALSSGDTLYIEIYNSTISSLALSDMSVTCEFLYQY